MFGNKIFGYRQEKILGMNQPKDFLTSRTLHIKLDSSLSMDAFISFFKIFIGNRGEPKVKFGDNGTNLQGGGNGFHEKLN